MLYIRLKKTNFNPWNIKIRIQFSFLLLDILASQSPFNFSHIFLSHSFISHYPILSVLPSFNSILRNIAETAWGSNRNISSCIDTRYQRKCKWPTNHPFYAASPLLIQTRPLGSGNRDSGFRPQGLAVASLSEIWRRMRRRTHRHAFPLRPRPVVASRCRLFARANNWRTSSIDGENCETFSRRTPAGTSRHGIRRAAGNL